MFSNMRSLDVQELHLFNIQTSTGGTQAVIALHNLKLGPALGGCRFIEYPSEFDAITDAMELAKGMSYKAALARVPQGGGKAVIMKPKGEFNRAEIFKCFGQAIQSMGGRYITAMDSGTTVADMDIIRSQSIYVSSTSQIGDPSPMTAKGVALGIMAAVHFKYGQGIRGLTIAIQGLGNVGMALAEYLHKAEANLIVSDVDGYKTRLAQQAYGATVVAPDDIYQQQCDVFSPCGLGGILNEITIEQLTCNIIAGSANNQLSNDKIGGELHQRGILYAPDYVINSGGLIFASSSFRNLSQSFIDHEVHRLGDTLNQIFILSKQKDLPCSVIADQMAEQILYHGAHSLILEAM
jgi:leucine dehydrogenase